MMSLGKVRLREGKSAASGDRVSDRPQVCLQSLPVPSSWQPVLGLQVG